MRHDNYYCAELPRLDLFWVCPEYDGTSSIPMVEIINFQSISFFIYIYVCMHVCMYVCVYVSIYLSIYLNHFGLLTGLPMAGLLPCLGRGLLIEVFERHLPRMGQGKPDKGPENLGFMFSHCFFGYISHH